MIVDDQGTLLTPTVAGTLPEGEVGYCIDEYLGYLFIGNAFGIRMAIRQNGSLTMGALIETNAPVYDFEGQNQFVWYTNSLITSSYYQVSNNDQIFNQFPKGTTQGLGRLDLSTFAGGAAAPAFANDLVAYDQTISDWPVFPVTSEAQVTSLSNTPTATLPQSITGVTTVAGVDLQRDGISGRRVFAMAGGRLFAEMLNNASPGWLEQGILSYAVEDNKAGLYQMAKWLPNTGTLYLDYKADGKDWFRNARVVMDETNVSTGNVSLDGLLFSRLQPRFVVLPTLKNPSPVTRWEMRSIPAKGKASKWQVPIMNYQELDINGVKAVRDPVSELEFLMTLVESGRLFNYQESGIVYSVHATGFEWKPESLTSSGTGWQGTYTLVVEEIV